MPRRLTPYLVFFGFLCAFLGGLPAARAQSTPPDGPAIDVAPEHVETAPAAPPSSSSSRPTIAVGSGTAPDSALVRGLSEQRFRRAADSDSGTSIGGYGEVQLRGTTHGREGDRQWVADIPRLVIFLAHSFNSSFRFYSELEVEHTTSCAHCPGALELEQAFIDWRLHGEALSARAGLIVVPMGIINQWHEPPIFHGVVRPHVDTVVIPSTWRELGVGFFGKPIEPIRYELYAFTALDPTKFGAAGLSDARQQGALATANAGAISARVEWEPLLGAVVGVSGYYSDVGPNAKFYDTKHQRVSLSVPVIGWDADVRFRRWGLEWRVVFAEWHLPEADALMVSRDVGGKLMFDPNEPVPTLMRGGYVEGAYDIFRPFKLPHQLLPFARLEFYNTQAAVPDRYAPDPSFNVREYTFGLTYRPMQQVVLKADYQLRNRRLGFDETQINFGLGFMY